MTDAPQARPLSPLTPLAGLAPEPPAPAAEPAAPARTSVLDKLRAHKDGHAGDTSFVLAETGVTVTLPKFRPHDTWIRSQRLGKSDPMLAQVYYIVALAKFDGERLTAGDYRELIPAGDHMAIVTKVFNGPDDDEEAVSDEKN